MISLSSLRAEASEDCGDIFADEVVVVVVFSMDGIAGLVLVGKDGRLSVAPAVTGDDIKIMKVRILESFGPGNIYLFMLSSTGIFI